MTVLLPVFALLDAEQLGDQQKWLRVPEEGTGTRTHAGASVEPVISKIANYRRDLAILGIVRLPIPIPSVTLRFRARAR